jgi:hypothetical protein
MSDTQSKIDSLQELNSKLLAEISELRKENSDVKAENTKLKQAMEENAELKIRFEELEKKSKIHTDNCPDFDLCSACKSTFNGFHDSTHSFDKMKATITNGKANSNNQLTTRQIPSNGFRIQSF